MVKNTKKTPIGQMNLEELEAEFARLDKIAKKKRTTMDYGSRIGNPYYNSIISQMDEVVTRIKNLRK